MPPPRYPSVALGPLPVDAVNATLGTELVPGNVRLSPKAHRHMAEDHAEDYAVCFGALRIAVMAPTFIGQAPGHTRNFEMIRRIARPDGKAVLVAVSLDLDGQCEYAVRSCYLIAPHTVDERRKRGRLRPPPPQP